MAHLRIAVVGIAVAASVMACQPGDSDRASTSPNTPTRVEPTNPPPPPSQPPSDSSSARPVPSPSAQQAVIYPCYSPPIAKPEELMLACGDGGLSLLNMTWRDWGMPIATAHGLLRRNRCVPSCAEGGAVALPSVVTVTDLRDGAYTSMRVAPQGLDDPVYVALEKDGPLLIGP
jgi:hypothetical protein